MITRPVKVKKKAGSWASWVVVHRKDVYECRDETDADREIRALGFDPRACTFIDEEANETHRRTS